MNEDLSPDERRARHRSEWETRIVPVLRPEWQSAATIAAALGAKAATVHERLNDMLKKSLVERRIVTNHQPVTPTRKKRRQRHVRRLEAQFRLPVQK